MDLRIRHPSGLPIAGVILVLLLSACASSELNAAPALAGSPVASIDRMALAESCEAGDVNSISVRGSAFDVACLSAPADETSSLRFRNLDRKNPHNLSIFDGGTPLFRGEPVQPRHAQTYAIPPIAEGVYTFECEMHEGMSGRLIAS